MLCHKTPLCLCLNTLVILHKITPYASYMHAYPTNIPGDPWRVQNIKKTHTQVWCMVLGLFMALTVVMQDRSCESLVRMAENFNIDHLWFFPICWPESLFPPGKSHHSGLQVGLTMYIDFMSSKWVYPYGPGLALLAACALGISVESLPSNQCIDTKLPQTTPHHLFLLQIFHFLCCIITKPMAFCDIPTIYTPEN